jgi:hypothetical protein
VSIELSRRLIASGAPLPAIEAALLAEVSGGVPFVWALLDAHPELSSLVERELERANARELHWVRAEAELVARLPTGLCERLLALPVRADARSGRVDVAAVDALAPHVGAELSFHLGAPVRVLRLSPAPMRAALAALSRHGTSVPPSVAPAPLVPLAPGAHGVAPELPAEPDAEAVPATPVKAAAFRFELELETALAELIRAESAERVAEALCHALEPAVTLVFSARGGQFEGRAASRSVDAEAFASLSLPVDKSSILDMAVRAGFYLGPLPATLVHSELRSALPGKAASELYAAPALVAQRAALVLVTGCFGPSLEATQRADRLLAAASTTLERIVRAKKRG